MKDEHKPRVLLPSGVRLTLLQHARLRLMQYAALEGNALHPNPLFLTEGEAVRLYTLRVSLHLASRCAVPESDWELLQTVMSEWLMNELLLRTRLRQLSQKGSQRVQMFHLSQ